MPADMRRRATTATLSPKLLKHFAAVTVVVTALLAVFASGEEWGVQAQVSAIEAKNELATTEAEKLGTRRVAAKLQVSQDPAPAGFDDSVGEPDMSGGGSYNAPPRRPANAGAWGRKGPGQSLPGAPGMPAAPLPGGAPQANPAPTAAPSPTAQDIARLTASSQRRSGTADTGE